MELVGSHRIRPEDVDGYELALQAVKRIRHGSDAVAEFDSMEASLKTATETNDGYAASAYRVALFAMRNVGVLLCAD